MKKHQIISLVVFFFILIVGASCFAEVTFSTFSGQLVDVQFSGKDFNKKATDEVILSNIKTVNKSKIQPLLDAAGSGAELLWKVDGPLNQIYKEIGNTNSSWIWSEALKNKLSLRVVLKQDGSGYIDLIQDQDLVGHIRCQSSALRDSEGGQPNQGKTTVWQKKADYENSKGVRMPNAIFIDKPGRKLAIHAGNLLTKSGGCVRIGIFASKQLYNLVSEGDMVEVVWE